jgi:sugar/nucleoside kinase (ribokinase family)
MSPFDVVGLGVSVVDIVQRVDYFPVKEEVQRSRDLVIQGGGPVATAMVTLARLGSHVAMLDVVGTDWRGDLILKEYREFGVCTDFIQRIEGFETSLATVLVTAKDGARTIVYYPGTTPELSPADVPLEVVRSAKILHLNGRHPEAWRKACTLARQAGVQVSFDGGASLFDPVMRDLVPLTDICIVARDFAQDYTGCDDLPAAGETLLQEGPGLVVITDGVRGSWVYSQEGEVFHQHAYLVPDVTDTTGCGDSYHGAFLYGLLQGLPLKKTASLASAVAALNSRGLGGRSALPTLDQAMEFLSQIDDT